MRHAKTITTLAALGALAGLPHPARAALLLTAAPSAATTGGTGFFDVGLTDTGATTYQVGAFSYELTVSGGPGVQFSSVNPVGATTPYVFGTYQSAPAPFAAAPFPSTASFPLTDFIASDAGSPTTVAPGDTFGLGRVFYNAGTTAGLFTVSFQDPGSGTSLADGDGNAITDFTTKGGTITVTPSLSAAPEPSEFAALGALGLGLGGLLLRARRRSHAG